MENQNELIEKAKKYDTLIGIILDNAWISPMMDRLTVADAKTSHDIISFLMAFEPEIYEQRYEELRR